MKKTEKVAPLDSEPKTASRPNLRHHHRVNTTLDAKLETQEGVAVECHFTNLSRAGVMAVCTPALIKTLLPKGGPLSPRQSVRLNARFELPVLNVQSVVVEAKCDVIYLRRISRNAFHLGMSFVSFEGSGQNCIDQYIDRKLYR